MGFSWTILLYVMANVMGLGHGGDGSAGDPPPPIGFGRGQHEHDAELPKKRRGVAKNIQLSKIIRANKGKPVDLDFDRELTYSPVGNHGDWFTREIGKYIWMNIPLNVSGWDNVSPALRNVTVVHLKNKFDLDKVNLDPERAQLLQSIDATLQRIYRGRKNKVHTYFENVGGLTDIPRAFANPPDGMSRENWAQAIEHFQTPEF